MSDNDNEDEVFETAARFFEDVRAADGVESDALIAWRDADPFHAQVYAQIIANWQTFDHHGADPEVLRQRQEALADARRAGSRRWQSPKEPTRRAMAAGIVAAVAVPAAAWWALGRGKALDFSTANGEQRTVTLADESRVFLDANTHVSVRFHGRQRDIDLVSGRAHFEVAKDETRPFNVHAGQEVVTAVGTAFVVELRQGATSVVLVEGRVKVNQKAGSAATQWMQPGDELMTGLDGARQLANHIDLEKASAWQAGKLIFDNETLANAVDRMNDYSAVKLKVEGSKAQNLRISGTFAAGRTDPFIDALQSIYPVRAKSTDTGITITSL